MQRIDTDSKAENLHGPGKHGFRGGDPVSGWPSTRLSPDWCNAVQEEICNVVEGAGLALDPASTTQLLAAIQKYAVVGADAVASVKSYGAVGDGETDDTEAFRKAIDSGAPRLRFPAGTFLVSSLVPVSDQTWEGDGQGRTILTWEQADGDATRSMIKSDGDLSNWTIRDMTLRGNRAYQTTPSPDGQGLAAIHLRGGSNENITIEGVTIEEFGDTAGEGGGAVMIGATAGTGQTLRDIFIRNNIFANISNVPGVYISAGTAGVHDTMENIHVAGNTFSAGAEETDQNCVYILGNSSLRGRNVHVDGNAFNVSESLDCCVELNWCDGWTVNDNIVTLSGDAEADGILIRSGCRSGAIGGNAFRNNGTRGTSNAAITLVRFNAGELIENVTIAGNDIYGWLNRGISADAGSRNVTITANGISGTATTRVSEALRVVNAENVKIIGNRVERARYGAIIDASTTGSTARVTFDGNDFDDCGNGSTSIIATGNVGRDVTGVKIRRNTVTNPVSGTANFVTPAFAAATGNRVESNDIPSTMNPVNASFASKVEAIVKPAPKTGTLLAGIQYSFSQGSISMADGQGFTIGANLDGSSPACALGDFVFASCGADLQGVTVTPYVSEANKIRIRVQNETGASVDVAAATWYVVVVRRA